MIECTEEMFHQLQHELNVPHKIAFDEHILKIAAGTRFALVNIFEIYNYRS